MKKLVYLEALRGVAALIVVFHHYWAAFYPAAVFGPGFPAHGGGEKLFTTTPLSLALGGHFAVCLFFILSGYVLSIPYFGDARKDTQSLLAAIVKRPFRLLGLLVASEIAGFILLHYSLLSHRAVSEVSGSIPWFRDAWLPGHEGLREFLFNLVTRPFAAGATYNPPLWTIEIELYGSFITFFFVLLFGKSAWRIPAYLVALVCFHGHLYQGFIYGIICADVARNCPALMERLSRNALVYSALALGLLLASYPAAVAIGGLSKSVYGYFPSLPFIGGGYVMLGAILIFAAVVLSPKLHTVLAHAPFAFLGRVSYALYVTHFLMLGSFSSWFFLKLHASFDYHTSFGISFSVSLVLLFLISHAVARYIDEPVTRLANRIGQSWRASLQENQDGK